MCYVIRLFIISKWRLNASHTKWDENRIMNGWLCWSVFKGFDRILMLLKHRLYYSGKEFDRENLCTFKLRCICVHISRFCMILPLQIQAFRRFQGSTITGNIIDRNDTKLIIWLHNTEWNCDETSNIVTYRKIVDHWEKIQIFRKDLYFSVTITFKYRTYSSVCAYS